MMKPVPEVSITTPATGDTTSGKRKPDPLLERTNDKKQFTRHGYRRMKKHLRIDFPNVNTREQTQTLWYEVMTILQNTDTTMLIHNPQTYEKMISSKEDLPSQQDLSNFTCIVENVQRRVHRRSYSSITTITTCRPIHEFKLVDPTFIQQLDELGVYLRSTNLSTVDTVEIGMFLGLHLSLTNVEWKAKQLNNQLGYNNGEPIFELYRRRLKLEETTTNAIVLRCTREDQEELEKQFLNLNPSALGESVECIPYRLVHQMSSQERKAIYHLQNQHIATHGAIAIQGISEDVMTEKVKDDTTLLEWFHSHEHVVQIEKSGTPGVQKLWVITKLSNRQKLEKYLDTTVKENMANFLPTRHQSLPSKEIKEKYRINEPTEEQSTNLRKLQERLLSRTKIVKPMPEAPAQGLRKKSYANVTTPKPTIETQEKNREIQELKQMMEKQTMTIKQITMQPRTIATSSLTPDTTLTNAIKQITEQQNAQFRQMMQDMLQSVFQQMFSLM